MPKATSTSSSSLSSILANSLIHVVGVYPGISNQSVKPSMRKHFSDVFTKRVQRKASEPGLWGPLASTIKVTIGNDDRVSVNAVGTPEEVSAAEMLEYGTPGYPPRAVMRTYEADFNEEYKVEMNRYGL